VAVLGLTLAVVAGIVIGAVAVFGQRQDGGPAGVPPAFTASARVGTTNAQLLQLEGQIVGTEAVVVPGERGPDVAASHRVGVAAMSIDRTSLTVKFLAEATQAQRDRVRSVLDGSLMIERVSGTGG
jgi:hypothetical protein